MQTIINLGINQLDHSTFNPIKIKEIANNTARQIKSTMKQVKRKKREIREKMEEIEEREKQRKEMEKEASPGEESEFEMEELSQSILSYK